MMMMAKALNTKLKPIKGCAAYTGARAAPASPDNPMPKKPTWAKESSPV